ncbi:MAG: hypothetical protein AABW73_01430 [Nanoarchaeota archaeon]
MEKYKIKAIITEELPEREIEAESKEEAEEKYMQMFENGEINGEEYEVDFGDGDEDEEDDSKVE